MRAGKKFTVVFSLLGLLCIAAVWTFRSHDDAFTEEGLLEANASDLRATVVTPHLEAPIAGEENILWCGSFQLAWNEACSLVGEDLCFGNEPAMVGILNKKAFTKQDIDAGCYVAVAGFAKDNVHGQITRRLQETFQGRATPRYIPPANLTPRPRDMVVYSYLFKNLEFSVPFERIENPIAFGAKQVPCFGIGEEYKGEHLQMLKQFVILDYQSEDDFVVELRTKRTIDRVILAKTQPGPTLAATVEAVQKRAANIEPTQPRLGDVLKVPKLNFDITRRFDELEGKHLLTKNPKVASDLAVLSALQNIRYQFNEKGVRLRSESHISLGCGGPPGELPPEHLMVFDKPFLIMLQNGDATAPYFALWVANPELLVTR